MHLRTFCAVATSLVLGACATSPVPKQVQFPKDTPLGALPNSETTGIAVAQPRVTQPSSGSIYASTQFRSPYADVRAQLVGDIITVEITERTNAKQTNATNVNRSDSASISTPSIGITDTIGIPSITGSASGKKDFKSGGSTTADNVMVGTITTTVVEVLPNGNLRVVGEKQIGTNREVERMRFYGVVSPVTIRNGNRVQSTQVADARIEYIGSGSIDSAQVMGWMSRVFLSILPF
jgi:flagellar L-ring protein precursor FlgH